MTGLTIDEDDYHDGLVHYGIPRKSGRYPWGSGDDPSTYDKDFLGYVSELQKAGLKDVEIARGIGISTTELRMAKSASKERLKQEEINQAVKLKAKGLSNVAIGKIMGKGDTSVGALLRQSDQRKESIRESTAAMLRDEVARKKYIDVGKGVEQHLKISREKLREAVFLLEKEDPPYRVFPIKVSQIGTNHETTIKVLVAPGTEFKEAVNNKDKIRLPSRVSDDGGMTFPPPLPPLSIDSKRVGVRYAEQGGTEADGVIYVRPGVPDTNLGGKNYAQVRIAVDGKKYLKGMAMYHPDLPDGVDLLFNTNKKDTGNKLDAMKDMKDDEDLPFGAVTRPVAKVDPITGERKVTSVMNIVNEEGNWDKWSKTLSSQMLSKQTPALAKKQLAEALDRKKADFDEIMKSNNPAVRRKMLESFADDADSSAIHLKAAALPRQANKVILPINDMPEHEVYAPTFRNGERVVLVRFPHGGIFEIPELTVNNRRPEAKKLLGDAPDAIGIHSKVAERLSGADFDGDTVLVIPNPKGQVKTAPALEGLKNFDPQARYPGYEGMPKMSAKQKGTQMGVVSNLITDMTIQKASPSELAAAVRHSMVVIDAEKHNLDWRASARDNGIANLMRKYQAKPDGSFGGASTVISRAKSEEKVPERKLRTASAGGPIDPVTGKKVYEYTGATYTTTKTKKNGEVVEKVNVKYDKQKSTKLAEVDDAHTLSSGTVIEKIYADHSNEMKSLANQARKELYNTKAAPFSPSAKRTYAAEVARLDAALNDAISNSPLERQAQVLANAEVAQKKAANPDLEKSEIKKLEGQALTKARLRVGAKKEQIEISPKEWEAIQAGAITDHKLRQILNHSDLDKVKELASPRKRDGMDSFQVTRAMNLLRSGYNMAEVADAIGVPLSTLKQTISEG